MKVPKNKGKRKVSGLVSYSTSGLGASGMTVVVMDAASKFDKRLGESKTDTKGKFSILYDIPDFRSPFECSLDIYLLVYDRKGQLVTTTLDSVNRNVESSQEIFILIPEKHLNENATIEIGNSRVNRSVFEQLEPKTLIEIANFAIQGRGSSKISKIINELSPDLNPKFLKSQLCFTPLIDFIRKTVLVKKWPRDIILKIEEILTGYDPEVSYVTSSCPHFTINYNNSGTDQPPSVDTGGNITMPGTGAIVGSTIGSNGIPDYVEKLCFWLENALALYTSPPFNLRNPSSSGRIPVYVTGTAPGSAGGGSMTIGRNLNDDLLAAVP